MAHKKMHDFLTRQCFLTTWLSMSTMATLQKRYTRAEIIDGFKDVQELHLLAKDLHTEIELLRKQHASRLETMRGAAHLEEQ